MAVKITLGTRVSPLAMAQTHFVRDLLMRRSGEPQSAFAIEGFTTTGDRIQDRKLLEAGGKGLFTKELDEALLEGRIDAAVHSMKDLPTRMPQGIALAAVPSREDPRDAFLCPRADTLMDLPPGAIVGTASLRRQAQTLNLRPDLKVVTLRGSVQTRLRKLAEGEIDATFLALAGLTRLGLTGEITSLVDSAMMLPAAGQGALAITCRSDDEKTLAALSETSISEHVIATAAERAFLDGLDGSCRTPIGALGIVDKNTLAFRGEVLTPDGKLRWQRSATVALNTDPQKTADALGRELAADIRREAGARYAPSSEGWS